MLTLIGMTDTYQKIQHDSQTYERIAYKMRESSVSVLGFSFHRNKTQGTNNKCHCFQICWTKCCQ